MNKRIEALKKKLKGAPHEEAIITLVESIKEKAEQDAHETTLIQAVQKSGEIFESIRNLMDTQDKSFQDVTNYLEKKSQELDLKNDKMSGIIGDVVKVLSKLSSSMQAAQQSTQKVSISNPAQVKLNPTQLKTAFVQALDKVENLLISSNEVPVSGKATYDGNGNVTSIREVYATKTVTTTFQWSGDGKMISWTTKEN